MWRAWVGLNLLPPPELNGKYPTGASLCKVPPPPRPPRASLYETFAPAEARRLADVKLAEDVGADQYIMKPAPTRALLDAVAQAVAKARARGLDAPSLEAETTVLRQYIQALVNKLEKNIALQEALAAAQRAHDRIQELNAGSERRVSERTAELEATNRELKEALANVKQLSGLLPMCAYCKKIRNDKNYWETVEGYISTHTDAHFSHGMCPACFDQQMRELNRIAPA